MQRMASKRLKSLKQALCVLCLFAANSAWATTNTNVIAVTVWPVAVSSTNGAIVSPTNGAAWFRAGNDIAAATDLQSLSTNLAAGTNSLNAFATNLAAQLAAETAARGLAVVAESNRVDVLNAGTNSLNDFATNLAANTLKISNAVPTNVVVSTGTLGGSISGRTIRVTVPAQPDLDPLYAADAALAAALARNDRNDLLLALFAAADHAWGDPLYMEQQVVDVWGGTNNIDWGAGSNATWSSGQLAWGATGGDPFDALLHMDGSNGSTSFVDEAGTAWDSIGGAQILVGQARFGQAGFFDATDDKVVTPGIHTNIFTFGSAGDFTVDCWIYWDGGARPYQNIIGSANGFSGNSSYFRVWGATDLAGKIGIGHPSADPDLTSVNTISANTWTHVAVTRSAGTLRIFINGALENSKTSTINYDFTWTTGTVIGDSPWDGAGGWYGGYIDELRVVKDVAVFTAALTTSSVPYVALEPARNMRLRTHPLPLTNTPSSIYFVGAFHALTAGVNYAVALIGTNEVTNTIALTDTSAFDGTGARVLSGSTTNPPPGTNTVLELRSYNQMPGTNLGVSILWRY